MHGIGDKPVLLTGRPPPRKRLPCRPRRASANKGPLARGKTTEEGGSKAWSEVLGLILLGAGTLLFLALVSYNPEDVPSWLFFSKQGGSAGPA